MTQLTPFKIPPSKKKKNNQVFFSIKIGVKELAHANFIMDHWEYCLVFSSEKNLLCKFSMKSFCFTFFYKVQGNIFGEKSLIYPIFPLKMLWKTLREKKKNAVDCKCEFVLKIAH